MVYGMVYMVEEGGENRGQLTIVYILIIISQLLSVMQIYYAIGYDYKTTRRRVQARTNAL